MDFSVAPAPVPAIIILGLFFWLLILTFLWWRTKSFGQRLTKGMDKVNWQALSDKLVKHIEVEAKRISDLGKIVEDIKGNNLYNIQKVGLVRFNPFAEAGGDQSFCLALLDGEDSGLVISSLHSRETTRIYAKPVRKGKSAGYDLSAEEKQAVLKAKKVNK